MPSYFSEGNVALPTDSLERATAKAVSLLPGVLSSWSQPPVIPFAPSDLSGLFEWFSADSGTFIYVTPVVSAQEGDRVTRWVNKVASGADANQTTENLQPTLKSDVFGTYLEFLGDVLTLSYPSAVNPPLTYYWVGSFGAGTNYLVNRNSSGTFTGRNALTQESGTLRLRASTSASSGFTANDASVVCGVLEGDGTGVVGLGYNLGAYTEVNLSNLGTLTATSLTNILGGSSITGANANCRIYEFLAYNQAHNEADRLQVVNYLREKYPV